MTVFKLLKACHSLNLPRCGQWLYCENKNYNWLKVKLSDGEEGRVDCARLGPGIAKVVSYSTSTRSYNYNLEKSQLLRNKKGINALKVIPCKVKIDSNETKNLVLSIASPLVTKVI